jgi:hypothetical protein
MHTESVGEDPEAAAVSSQAENGLLLVTIRLARCVAAGDKHEHQVRRVRIETGCSRPRQRSTRGDPLQPIELLIEAALALGVGEQGDPFGRGAKGDAVASEAGPDPQGDREVRLPVPGRPEEDDVLFAGEEVQLAQVQDGEC